jgi:hypothetical protein
MIVHTRIEGSQLAGNLLGDPTERDLFVYLPPGYDESERRYPTAYLLHAYGETAEQLVTPATDGQRWRPQIEDVLDPVFGRMGVSPMVVVMPDGTSRYGCGQWVDSPVSGHFEQYVLHDVIPYVDGAYRTLPAPESRGVFGFSSGGFGAWNLASRNPDVFGAMAVLSADSWLDMTHKFLLYKYLDSIWPEAPNGPVEGNLWSEIVYDYAATYSPNPDNPPFYVDLPMAWPSGELRQDVWNRWLSFDPVVNVHERWTTCASSPASCSTPAPTTTTTCTGVTGCSATISTRPRSHTSTGRTPAITAGARTSGTRWRSNGSRTSSPATSPDQPPSALARARPRAGG